MSPFFASGGQSIEVSASASVLPVNIQDFTIDWLDLLTVQGTLKSLLKHHNSKHPFSSFLYSPTLTSIQTTEKIKALSRQNFIGKVMSLLFNMLSRLVIAFILRSKLF